MGHRVPRSIEGSDRCDIGDDRDGYNIDLATHHRYG